MQVLLCHSCIQSISEKKVEIDFKYMYNKMKRSFYINGLIAYSPVTRLLDFMFMLGNCSCFCCRLLKFFKINFFHTKKSGTLSECQTGLDSDQHRPSFSPDLDQNCFTVLAICRQQMPPLARKGENKSCRYLL